LIAFCLGPLQGNFHIGLVETREIVTGLYASAFLGVEADDAPAHFGSDADLGGFDIPRRAGDAIAATAAAGSAGDTDQQHCGHRSHACFPCSVSSVTRCT
jgi:hypothetical protein